MAGRPTDYTEELALTICERIAAGDSVRTIVSNADMPSKQSIFNWLARHEGFVDQYARAREMQADVMAEDILEIADAKAESQKDVNYARHRVDTRKWLMSKMKPKKYGDKLGLEHQGSIAVTFTPVDDDI